MTAPLLSDEDFAKSAEETGAPLPTDFAATTGQFERWISGGLAPLVGLNLFLFGCLKLGSLGGASAVSAASTSLLLGLAAVFAVAKSNRALVPSYSDYVAVGLSALLLSCALLVPGFTLLAALVLVVALFVAVFRGRVHGRSFALFGCWLLPLLKQAATPQPILLATFLLVPSAILLVLRKFLGAAFVLVIIVLSQAGMELAQNGQGAGAAVLLCSTALLLALFYEIATPIREFSTFRLLLGQLPVVVALVLLVWSTLPQSLPLRGTIWVLAAATIVFQLLRTYVERASVPARLAWVGLALSAAVLAEMDLVSADSKVCQLVVISGGLHILAVVLRASALAEVGALILLAVLSALTFSKPPTSFTLVLSLTVTGVALVLASERFPVEPPLPWWSGFIRKAHAEFAGRVLVRIFKRISEFALVKLFFGWVSVLVVWLRFALDAALKSDVRPIVNLAGHAALAIFATQKLVEWIGGLLPNHEALFVPTLSTVMCSAYGVGLVARGRKTGRFFSRSLGLALAVFPAVWRALHWRSIGAEELGWLLLSTGCGLAMIGLLIKQPKKEASPTEAHASQP